MTNDCWCCSCKVSTNGDDSIYELDKACRNHGAHGKRECLRHKSQPEPCKWGDGCGMTIDKVLEGEH